jgi:hypothetical protein
MYAAHPSKASLESVCKKSDEQESVVAFDSRLDDIRGSIDDLVRTGSIISSECNSPLLMRRMEDSIGHKLADKSTVKSENRQKLCIPAANFIREIKVLQVDLETASNGSNFNRTVGKTLQTSFLPTMKGTPTEKCFQSPMINPINREGYRKRPSPSRSPAKHKVLFDTLQEPKTSFQAALNELNKKSVKSPKMGTKLQTPNHGAS